jgi:hypothetical protein
MRSRRSESRAFCRRCRGRFTNQNLDSRYECACFLPNTSPEVASGKQPGATFLCDRRLSTRRLSMPSPQWRTEAMLSAIPNGTDVWMAVPASPPLRMTIRACLDDCCDECRLPVYRCESEGGQMLRLCASHLRLPN